MTDFPSSIPCPGNYERFIASILSELSSLRGGISTELKKIKQNLPCLWQKLTTAQDNQQKPILEAIVSYYLLFMQNKRGKCTTNLDSDNRYYVNKFHFLFKNPELLKSAHSWALSESQKPSANFNELLKNFNQQLRSNDHRNYYQLLSQFNSREQSQIQEELAAQDFLSNQELILFRQPTKAFSQTLILVFIAVEFVVIIKYQSNDFQESLQTTINRLKKLIIKEFFRQCRINCTSPPIKKQANKFICANLDQGQDLLVKWNQEIKKPVFHQIKNPQKLQAQKIHRCTNLEDLWQLFKGSPKP
jgi:hypothetical protein